MPNITYSYHGRLFASDEHLLDSLLDNNSIEKQLELGKRLGQGSYGEVYEALPKEPDSISYPNLVIKMGYAETEALREQLRKEANMFRLVHGGPAYINFHGERYFLLCKRLPGKTLKHYLDDQALPRSEKLRLLKQVFLMLEEQLHRKGIFHGDLKPDNIMVELQDGGSYQINFIDFGWSYLTTEQATGAEIDSNKTPVRS